LAAGAAGEISTKISTLGVGGGNLYAGGDFIRAGSAGVLGIARWDGVEWSALMGPKTMGAFLSTREVRVVSSNNIYIGGSGMLVIGGKYVNRIAHWDGANWDSMAGGLTGTGTVGPNSIIEQGGLVYVGGSFTNAGGVNARNVAVWDGANWYPLASGLNNSVNALAFHNGQLFAGGAFTARGNGTGSLHGFAVWDGNDWQDVPTSSFWRINNVVNALVSDGINLYMGGNFLIGWQYPYPPYDGQTLENVGRWDGANWWALGGGLTNNTVNALAIQNGRLYAGGSFTNAGGTALRRIAQWDGSSWSAVGAGFTNGTVSALAATPTDLYAGGSFTNTGGLEVNRIAKWAGNQWFPLGSGVSNTAGASSSSVSGIGVHDDDVYLAGSFNRAGGKAALGVARWNETMSFAPPPPIRLLNPRRQSGLMTFDISGVSTGTYSVLASTNLVNWQTIHTDTAANTNYTDPASASLRRRCYRVQQP
jgi:trimeric autotransporter adhesin